MRNLTKSLMLGSLLATAAFADFSIAIPGGTADVATAYGVGADTTGVNAKKIKDMSGATYYVGKASSASLTETTLGELSLKYSLVYAAADGAYGTAVGILLPMTAAWDIKDLTKMTSIDFQIKCATAGLTAHLIIGSDAYPADMAKENSALVGNSIKVTTSYAPVSVLPADLLPPTWAKATSAATTGWIADGTVYTTGIGAAVKDLNFQPILDPAWNKDGSGFTSTAAATAAINNTLSIKNVVIKGIRVYSVPAGTGCVGTFAFLDDFQAISWVDGSARTGNAPNYFGGYWYAFSDTTSNPVAGADTANGASTITLPTGKRVWMPNLTAGIASVTATLEKNVATSTYLYHPYAGWTDIGTDLTDANGVEQDFSAMGTGSLTSIGFDIYAGAALASVIPGAAFDTTLVPRIILKLGKKSVTDDAPYQVSIPSDTAAGPNGLLNVCVDLANFQQPSWYNSKHGGAQPLVVNDLTKIAWEMKIEDQKTTTIHTSGPNTFGIANVKFYGLSKSDIPVRVPDAGVKGKASAKTLAITYNGISLTLSNTVAGSQIEVLRLDGSKVASFKTSSATQSFPVSLKRGNYVVTVAGASKRIATNLAVAN